MPCKRFFKALGASKVIRKSRVLLPSFENELLRQPPIYFLVSCSSAELTSAFIGIAKITKCKLYLGLILNCKFVSGFLTKKCKLFLGRDNNLVVMLTQEASLLFLSELGFIGLKDYRIFLS